MAAWAICTATKARWSEARAHYDAALVIDREVGNRIDEGAALGNLAGLLVRQERIGEAQEALKEGEALLREAGNPLELAKLLCTRGRAEVAAGDLNLARAALAEAETMAAAIGAGPDSELCHQIAKLRAAVV